MSGMFIQGLAVALHLYTRKVLRLNTPIYSLVVSEDSISSMTDVVRWNRSYTEVTNNQANPSIKVFRETTGL